MTPDTLTLQARYPGAILEAAYPDENCGCPVEEWIVEGVTLQLHFEADGSMEAFADTGEWEAEVPLKAATMDAARDEAFAWVEALPTEDEVWASAATNPRANQS